jgi:hypothetical protein
MSCDVATEWVAWAWESGLARSLVDPADMGRPRLLTGGSYQRPGRRS